jgi:hypothetical protein
MPKRIPERPRVFEMAQLAGPVADPGPELILDKVRLSKLKLAMIDQQIAELNNQIKIAQTYRDMIKEQYNI